MGALRQLSAYFIADVMEAFTGYDFLNHGDSFAVEVQLDNNAVHVAEWASNLALVRFRIKLVIGALRHIEQSST